LLVCGTINATAAVRGSAASDVRRRVGALRLRLTAPYGRVRSDLQY